MKKTKKFDPFENLVLDEEEQALEDAFERGEYVEMPNLAETNLMLRDAVINEKEISR